MINVIIADDHPYIIEGVKHILNQTGDIRIVDQAENGQELLSLLDEKKHDIVLLDISMPGRKGFELLDDIKKQYRDLPVIIFSMHSEELYALRCLKYGASGYVTKTSAPGELIDAIYKVKKGEKYITPKIADKLVDYLKKKSEKPLHESLSNREFEVMCMIASGKTITNIAKEFMLSVQAISTYKKRIMQKMNFNSTVDIVNYVKENKLSI